MNYEPHCFKIETYSRNAKYDVEFYSVVDSVSNFSLDKVSRIF